MILSGSATAELHIFHSVHPHPFLQEGGGWASNQIYKRISTFRRGDVFQGDCNFHVKNKLESEVLMTKKVL